ncbi:LolA family protein [Thalassospira mesophila]|uniref:Outer membrane lipoprotein carrier protein LolA n=1 Tax=Thalassospira mesophila TaxID=1293891 RepID=A0A1Y2L1I7_9PROT|nr:outer membrane lipoprotein carrier protein LolA [Thalassospira mesophila]OSQ38319.1 hypothetical protein TMES_10600 [Thalassospira mesophila]
MTLARFVRSLLLAGSVICALGAPETALARPGIVALEKNQYLHGDFTLNRHLNGFSDGLKSQGEFVLVPATGLIWQTKTPFPGTTVLGPGGIVNIDANGERSQLGTGAAQFGIFVDLISSVLAGNWSALENRFHVEFSPPGDNTDIWQVKLTPFGESAIGGQITDIVAIGDDFVQQVRLNKPGGDFDDITLSAQQTANLPLPKDKADLLPKADPK